MRDNFIMSLVIITFIIGYFIFTSKLNKDTFINQNIADTRGYILNTENYILKRINISFKNLYDIFF
jgi:hypothetical protein